ncbi:MAG TPA: hypothetical protein VMT55_00320, partial [Candidatus Sulfotelmatobacter sp.]|nr:hypothetical protein [Candidatus Sulfotelmatobacter sp.]
MAAGIVVFDFLQVREKFPARTFIGAAEVTGLDKTQALAMISRFNVSELFSAAVTFEPAISQEGDTFSFTFSPEAVGIMIDAEKTVNQAFSLTHHQGYLNQLSKRLVREQTRCP